MTGCSPTLGHTEKKDHVKYFTPVLFIPIFKRHHIFWRQSGSQRVCVCKVMCDEAGMSACVYRGDGLAPCICLQVQDMNVIIPTSPRAVPLQ